MSKTVKDPGIGTRFDRVAERSINKDGSFNIKRVHFNYNFKNTYQWMIRMNWFWFLCLITAFILSINCCRKATRCSGPS